MGEARTRTKEDPALLRGNARFTDDFQPSNALHAAFRRSRLPHARIGVVEVADALDVDGVVSVLAAADLPEVGAPTTVRSSTSLRGRKHVERPTLAGTVARYAGEPVAFVLAEDRYAAHEAADAIRIESERLPAATDPDDALDLKLPSVDDMESERLGWAGRPARVDWSVGDEATVSRAFDEAAHVVSLPIENQRIAPVPIEPRALLAEYDTDAGTFTVTSSTQKPHADRERLAHALDIPPDSLRVRAPAVGGGFGAKGSKPYPEEPLVVWAAGHHGRPIRWSATRTEAFHTDHHGRDVHLRAEMAFDERGHIEALRVGGSVALGAYPFRGPSSCVKPKLLSGAYSIPAIHCSVVGVLTNNTPLGSYRGAGRPETIFVVERLVDRASRVLEVDPIDLRRRNYIQPDEFPYETATGALYDSGDYDGALDWALELADYELLVEDRTSERADGRLVGVGVASYVENTSSSDGHARLVLHTDGEVTAFCGTADQGQGHATTFAALIAAELGVPDDRVTIREGDTAYTEDGGGAVGSRSAASGGGALVECAAALVEQGRAVAAEHLEVAPEDVRFADGEYHVQGAPDRSLRIAAVPRLAADQRGAVDATAGDPTRRPGLSATTVYRPKGRGYSFGTHVAAVEVDAATGDVDLRRYVAVDDCGNQLNPRLVEGQIHGGACQGLGQALYEAVEFDDAGNLLTGSLQDYALPRAADLPDIATGSTVTPSPWAPHGAKGVGEAGTIATPPAVVNAVADALEPLGVEPVDMPVNGRRLWTAIRSADDG